MLVIDFADGRDESSEDFLERLSELPPSAKLVYKTLEYEGPLTQSGIAEEALMPGRTIRYAISKLTEANLVSEEVYVPDARKQVYRLTHEESGQN